MAETQTPPSSSPPPPPPPSGVPSAPPAPQTHLKTILIASALGIVFLLAATLILSLFLRPAPSTPAPPPPPPSTVVPPIIPPKTPTKWASDGGVLLLKESLSSVSAQVDSVDLYEPELSPPTIDLGISIK